MPSGLSPELVLSLMSQGIRQSEIAKGLGVSRQYVNKLAKEGGYQSAITEVTNNLPWKVPSDYVDNTIYKAVRLHGHFMVAGRDALNGTSYDKLRSFYRKLVRFNQVVDYDPDYPAVPGLVNGEGFAFVNRQPEDKDFIIRMKPTIRLTPVGEKIWRLPEEVDKMI